MRRWPWSGVTSCTSQPFTTPPPTPRTRYEPSPHMRGTFHPIPVPPEYQLLSQSTDQSISPTNQLSASKGRTGKQALLHLAAIRTSQPTLICRVHHRPSPSLLTATPTTAVLQMGKLRLNSIKWHLELKPGGLQGPCFSFHPLPLGVQCCGASGWAWMHTCSQEPGALETLLRHHPCPSRKPAL